MHQIGVERVVARHEHQQGALPASSGPAALLPERRDGTGEAGDDHRVQTGDVDAQFERIGRGDAQQGAVGQIGFEFAPILGQIPCAIGGDASYQLRIDVGENSLGTQRGHLGSASGPHECQSARALHQ